MRIKFFVATVAALGLLAAPSARAATQPDIVSPTATYAGKTYAEWSASWWQWSLPQPAAHHPLSGAIDAEGTADPRAGCDRGQSGPVWFLGAVVGGGTTVTRHCTVPRGIALYFPVGNTECSSIEPKPFFGATADARRRCAEKFIDRFLDVTRSAAQIDGVEVGDWPARRVTSPDFAFSLPPCPAANVLGVDCALGGGRAVDNGFYLLLRPLAPGPHVIHFTNSFPAFDFTMDITYVIQAAG
jgi:hypothetical protein